MREIVKNEIDPLKILEMRSAAQDHKVGHPGITMSTFLCFLRLFYGEIARQAITCLVVFSPFLWSISQLAMNIMGSRLL